MGVGVTWRWSVTIQLERSIAQLRVRQLIDFRDDFLKMVH
jgi:hypothetical protein